MGGESRGRCYWERGRPRPLRAEGAKLPSELNALLEQSLQAVTQTAWLV